jgi:hypothetical protein
VLVRGPRQIHLEVSRITTRRFLGPAVGAFAQRIRQIDQGADSKRIYEICT